MRKILVHPNQKVITTTGEVAIVAFVRHGQVFVFGRDGLPKAVDICCDAFGGEHDQTVGLAA